MNNSRWRLVSIGRLFFGIVMTATLALLACSGGQEEVSDADLLRGQVTLTPFKSELMGALTQAVARSPVDAIEVCRVQAPLIAESAAGDGVVVGRTSHKLRNPDNSPQSWTHRWLRHYLEHPGDRDPRAEYLDAETIGYVEPIYIKPLCLTCHGDAIAPAVAARIDSLYPHDRARGYEDGDFRGLFWMTMPARPDGEG